MQRARIALTARRGDWPAVSSRGRIDCAEIMHPIPGRSEEVIYSYLEDSPTVLAASRCVGSLKRIYFKTAVVDLDLREVSRTRIRRRFMILCGGQSIARAVSGLR